MFDTKIVISAAVREAWDIYRKNFWVLFAATLLLLVFFSSVLFIGPASVGWCNLALHAQRENEHERKQISFSFCIFFGPFLDDLGRHILLGMFFAAVMITGGATVVGAFFFAGMVVFLFPMTAEKSYWGAGKVIAESYLFFRKRWKELIPLAMTASLIAFSGLLIFGIGILLTIPLGLLTIVSAFQQVNVLRFVHPVPTRNNSLVP